MHVMPVDRGNEADEELCDDPQLSWIYDQAENRLHLQKAILALTLGGFDGRDLPACCGSPTFRVKPGVRVEGQCCHDLKSREEVQMKAMPAWAKD